MQLFSRKNFRSVRYVSVLLLSFFFLVSLAFYFIAGNGYVKRVLFFPAKDDRRMSGEIRYLTHSHSLEANITVFLKELILGPAALDLSRIVNKETSLRSVLFRNGTLYIDFDENIIFRDVDANLPFPDALDFIRHGVFKNFDRVKKIYVTVNGQMPENWHETEENKKNKSR